MYRRLRSINELFAKESEELVDWAESFDRALAEKAGEYSKQVEGPGVQFDPDVEMDPLVTDSHPI